MFLLGSLGPVYLVILCFDESCASIIAFLLQAVTSSSFQMLHLRYIMNLCLSWILQWMLNT